MEDNRYSFVGVAHKKRSGLVLKVNEVWGEIGSSFYLVEQGGPTTVMADEVVCIKFNELT